MNRNPDKESIHGFSLKSVCWGYRDIFARAIDGLITQGLIGDERKEVTAKFFELLGNADQSCFDHVLKEFLSALNPRTRWLMDLPAIFTDVTDTGRQFAESKLYYGIGYFRILGESGFGTTPNQVRELMTHVRRLREIDEDLAFALLKGYKKLLERLHAHEIGLYIKEGLKLYTRNRKSAFAFMEGTLMSSENIIASLTRECRLSDIQETLHKLLRALVGYEVEVADLGQLDSDDLIERGTHMVCMYRWLYLPLRIRYFEDATKNHDWYMLMTVVAAGMLMENSFSRIHGHPEYSTCRDLIGNDLIKLNLFQIMEYSRIMRRIRSRWPGAKSLIKFGLQTEFSAAPPTSSADRLLHDMVMEKAPENSVVRQLKHLLESSINAFATAAQIEEVSADEILRIYEDLDRFPLRTFALFPDFLFPGEVSNPPADSLVADLKQDAERSKNRKDEDDRKPPQTIFEHNATEDNDKLEENDDKPSAGISACFLYDEWSQPEGDYYRDFCSVYEEHPETTNDYNVHETMTDDAARIRRVFERFKPDLLKREKYLEDGEQVNLDLLLDYLAMQRREPSPRVRFYEQPRVQQRDLAVLILLDASGSTGETIGQEKVIDIEKRSALLLGEGLAALGDRFAICGFSSNGPEHCAYYVYKDFYDEWDQANRRRVWSARPANATRIGAALRHSGYRLAQIGARQRLVILVTDGKPMDSGYDPQSRYAQHDVRMACEENTRMCIHTFAISTEENSVADMTIMFPKQRFAILSDIRCLPRVLPRLYVKMTI